MGVGSHRGLDLHFTPAEAWAGCWCNSWTLVGKGREQGGLRWRKSVNVKTCGKSWWNLPTVLAIGFLFPHCPKLLVLPVKAGYCEHQSLPCMAAIGSPWFSSLFLANSVSLSFAGLGRWNWSWTFMWHPKDWENWSLISLFLSCWGECFLAGEFHFGNEQCQFGGKGWFREN